MTAGGLGDPGKYVSQWRASKRRKKVEVVLAFLRCVRRMATKSGMWPRMRE